MVSSKRERAQLLLIAGVIIAAFVLSTIVLLNLLHESPEFSTEQERHSVTDSERLGAQLHHDLHQYFLAHSANESFDGMDGSYPDDPSEFRLPFAKDEFEDEIDGYDDDYGLLASQSRAAVVDIEYVSGETGNALWSNGTSFTQNPDAGIIISNADEIPRLRFEFDSFQADELDIGLYDGTTERNITADVTGVEVGGEEVFSDTPEILDLTYGSGYVSDGEQYKQLDVDLDQLSQSIDVSFDYDTEVRMEWVMTTEGGSVETDFSEQADEESQLWYEEDDVIVNPTFHVAYEDPSITYESDIQLFEEGDA